MRARRGAAAGPEAGVVPRAAARALITAVLLAGCLPGRQKPEPVPRRSPARDSLLAADLRRSDTLVARGFTASMSALLATDAVYLRHGAPAVFGRDNVLALINTSAARAGTPLAWQPIGGGVSGDRLSGYTFGIALHAGPGTSVPAVERYIAYWSRPRAGAWRIVAYAEVGEPRYPPIESVAGTAIPRRQLSGDAQHLARTLIRADSLFSDDASRFGLPDAFGNAIADDGVMFAGSEVLVGPRAVREFFQSGRGASLTWTPVYASGAASGDLGFTVGEAIATSRGASGAAVQRFTKYLTIWRKEPGGGWKFVVDGGNSRPSPIGN
jgi:ketosteroid isomerase-like protein